MKTKTDPSDLKDFAKAVGIKKKDREMFIKLYKMGLSLEKAKSIVEGK